MQVVKCALGVIQARGKNVIAPQLVALGVNESDYFVRHVRKVRAYDDATARCSFTAGASTPGHLQTLRSTSSDREFAEAAGALQDLLSVSMRQATNAKDCVFAVVRTTASDQSAPHTTLLKLDAVIEAARLTMLQSGGVSFEVLKDLLPEPGDLQKGLSWPDPRAGSEVLSVDRNRVAAMYFENAYQVQVSMRAPEAETALVQAITERVDPASIPAALQRATEASGPLDEVLEELSHDFPELAEPAQEQSLASRPAGIVRPQKATARPLVWHADGIEVVTPAHLLGNVQKNRAGDGWELVIRSRTEPTLGPK